MDEIDDMAVGTPENVILNLDKALESPKYSGKDPPNVEMARIYEWKAVMLDILLEDDQKLAKDCIRAAKRAEEYSSMSPYPAKNPECFYPILARDATKESLQKGIYYYKLAEDDAKVKELEKEVELLELFDDSKVKEPKEKYKPGRDVSPPEEEKLLSSLSKEDEWISKWGGTLEFGDRVAVSTINGTNAQIGELEKLRDLCSHHVSLLKVVGRNLSEGKNKLLVEHASPAGDHFSRIFDSFTDKSSCQKWWDHIQGRFQKIFQGVIQGLIHLYRHDMSCGHLSFNTYVTTLNGEGRILPSLESKDTTSASADMKELIDLMKTIIHLAHNGHKNRKCVLELPSELNHFFTFISPYDHDQMKIPAFFWIDHPYFWSIKERIAFTCKLRKLFKMGSLRPTELDVYLPGRFKFWPSKLENKYQMIRDKAAAKRDTEQLPAGSVGLKPYTLKVDIVRFFTASQAHVNDDEYGAGPKLTEAEIEKDLSSFFPFFYTDMHSALCCWSFGNKMSISSERLKEWGLTNFHFNNEGLESRLPNVEVEMENFFGRT